MPLLHLFIHLLRQGLEMLLFSMLYGGTNTGTKIINHALSLTPGILEMAPLQMALQLATFTLNQAPTLLALQLTIILEPAAAAKCK